MIRVRFTTSEFNAETQEWVKLSVAELVADGDDVRISGPHAEWINPDVAIIDPQTTERVTRADGAPRRGDRVGRQGERQTGARSRSWQHGDDRLGHEIHAPRRVTLTQPLGVNALVECWTIAVTATRSPPLLSSWTAMR